MHRSSSRDSADRHGNAATRTTIEAVDDTQFVQQTQHRLFSDEQQDQIEHLHPYGFTSVAQKPTGTGLLRQAAEAVMNFLGANRSHGIAVMVGDRRFRLYKLAGGEVALHDDQGQQVHMSRSGVYVSAPNSKTIVAQIMADDVLPQDSQAQQGGQKLGQIAQKGRPVAASYSIDKNSFTVSHPTAINMNAPTIVLNGKCLLGGPDASIPAAMLGTVDTGGFSDTSALATKVFLK